MIFTNRSAVSQKKLAKIMKGIVWSIGKNYFE